MRLGAVLMASGSSKRFGQTNKLLSSVDGVPMISRVMGAVPAELFETAVVVSCYEEILALGTDRGYVPLYNPYAEEGQSASIRLGTQALREMDGILFAVCDQPWLRPESVRRLIRTFSEDPDTICALSYQGQKGNPVIFSRLFFPELLSLTGEQRGGPVIKAHPDRLRLVEVTSARELRDVDTPEGI